MNVPTEVTVMPVYQEAELTSMLTGGLLCFSNYKSFVLCKQPTPLGLTMKCSRSPVATEFLFTLDVGSNKSPSPMYISLYKMKLFLKVFFLKYVREANSTIGLGLMLDKAG